MEKKHKKTLFIFRRDLRLEDNSGLIYALSHSDEVIPCFIFNPLQLENNPYRSDHCIQFMLESLQDLNEQLKGKGSQLYLFYGQPHEMIEKCIKTLGVDCVVFNRDYTPFSKKRDDHLKPFTKKITVVICEDCLLHAPETTLKENGQPYSIFSPYYKNASSIKVRHPEANIHTNYFHDDIAFAQSTSIYKKILPHPSKQLKIKGGRKKALEILKTLGDFRYYDENRDFPELDATTHLSAHLKFTTVSPREVYYAVIDKFNKHHGLIRALYWRDFFHSIALFSPHVFQGAFHKKFNSLSWSQDTTHFLKWCEGKTGFPIIDAGMRELNQTGFMHNRVRMIVASFLTKDLHISWQWGEKYFAQKLIDYDPSVNNGNWQWAASTGCDAQPYFRIFNPWNQQKKFDLHCTYIKKWIPELVDVQPQTIHQWYLVKHHLATIMYPAPIIEHDIEAKHTLALYRNTTTL
jgi:deoxyribodipyrimidine photo-lyase